MIGGSWDRDGGQQQNRQEDIVLRCVRPKITNTAIVHQVLLIKRTSVNIMMISTKMVSWFRSLRNLACENSRHSATPTDVWEMSAEIPYWWRELPRSGKCFWLVVARGKFALTNQKNYLDMGSDTSPVWNFCIRSAQRSFRGYTSGVVTKCRLFSNAMKIVLSYRSLLSDENQSTNAALCVWEDHVATKIRRWT